MSRILDFTISLTSWYITHISSFRRRWYKFVWLSKFRFQVKHKCNVNNVHATVAILLRIAVACFWTLSLSSARELSHLQIPTPVDRNSSRTVLTELVFTTLFRIDPNFWIGPPGWSENMFFCITFDTKKPCFCTWKFERFSKRHISLYAHFSEYGIWATCVTSCPILYIPTVYPYCIYQ